MLRSVRRETYRVTCAIAISESITHEPRPGNRLRSKSDTAAHVLDCLSFNAKQFAPRRLAETSVLRWEVDDAYSTFEPVTR